MSDFLSNFDSDNYKNTLEDKQQKKEHVYNEPMDDVEMVDDYEMDDDFYIPENKFYDQIPNEPVKKVKRKRKKRDTPETDILDVGNQNSIDSVDHDVEIDPDYENNQKKRKLTIGIAVVVTLLVFYFIYYQVTRVKVPNFEEKSIVDVRKWATENRIDPIVKQEYSVKVDANNVISQSISPNKKVKKGSKMTFKVSEGANPKEKLKLPDFDKMSKSEVEQWIEKNKAENVSIIDEYSDKVEKGKFIKLEFTDKDVNKENYLRQDIANVYFSKGKEVFEKNISVPDFNKKQKTDVEDWAKKNEIKIDYKEVDSDKIETGMVVSQSVNPDTKIAKHDSMTVSISIGKAVVVPNFADYSSENAQSLSNDLQIMVKQVFSDTVPYGQLISQSVESGKKLTGDDNKSINLVYSCGKPYIKSYFDQLEGDIPKILYDEFNSKGASVTYDVYYIDSEQPKGQIVKASAYNEYISTNSHISFGISNGKNASTVSDEKKSDE